MDDQKKINTEFASASDPLSLGSAIKNARLNAGLSQGKLEKASNISIRTISRIETGKGATPNIDTLKEIAKATNSELQIRFCPKVEK